jgi:hypothetical protein
MTALPSRPRALGGRRWQCAALLVLLVVSPGCGRRGDPLPPLRYVPNVTSDLSVRQQGDLVTLELGYPRTTASGLALPGLHAVEIWSLATDQPAGQARAIDARSYQQAAGLRATIEGAELESAVFGDRLRFRLPLETLAAVGTATEDGGSLVLAVRTVSTTAETSDFSNLAALDLEAPLPAPGELTVTGTQEGIELAWTAGQPGAGFTVYRRGAEERGYGAPIGRTAPEERRFLDRDARFGESYFYTVRTIAGEDPLVESAPAVEREIAHRDVFPPDPPAGLLALAEGDRVRLVIEPSPSSDVAGYVLYRRDPGADFRRVTRTSAERLEHVDTGLASGLTFTYRATAVDTADNEGPPGDEVAVTVQ